MIRDIIVASCGGQGGLLATAILASVFVEAGYDVKTSEVHGMAQRGGTVISYVRRGKKVYSPLVEKGCADTILGLEILEAYRQLPNLKPGGIVVTSDEKVYPVSVTSGDARYPDLGPESFLQRAGRVFMCPSAQLAREAGNVRSSNVVCLGALSGLMEIPESVWISQIQKLVPQKTVEVNLNAFWAGRTWLMKQL